MKKAIKIYQSFNKKNKINFYIPSITTMKEVVKFSLMIIKVWGQRRCGIFLKCLITPNSFRYGCLCTTHATSAQILCLFE